MSNFKTVATFTILTMSLAGLAHALETSIKDGKGTIVGSATITDTKQGVSLAIKAHGLPEGAHALHIHEGAKCEAAAAGHEADHFKSAGGHYNPTKAHHGVHNEAAPHPHVGDLPSIQVAKDGTASAQTILKQVAKASELSGRTVVIHAGPDDDKSDPAGNSGPRIACGEIK